MAGFSDTFTYENIDFDIDYNFYPEEKQVYNYGDGSGYSGSPAEVEILRIEIGGYDMGELLKDYVIEALENLILENH